MLRITSYYLIIFFLFFVSSCSKTSILRRVSPKESGVYFENSILGSDNLSILDYLYFYNGAGVAAGDFNNDSLQDLFFVSNQGQNKLYINEGDLVFKDVTSFSGIESISTWNTGVSIVDVNNDGWSDIYVNAVVGINGFSGHNELWINQKDGTFLERSKEYGLDLAYYGVSTAFFDYDKDGDLDAYVVNHGLHPDRNLEYVKGNQESKLLPSNDRLLRNDDGVFSDVTKESGLVFGNIGYGLAVTIADFDQDGWDDIYVSNDFYENDYFYLNQGDGTFKESLSSFFTQTSQFSMGVDSKDLNNDSYQEILTLDMLPEDEITLKRSIDDNNPQSIRRRRSLGYIDQFPRNHLQLNYGGRSFRDIASKAGIEATDWSWSSLFADLNNDGKNDLYISNGILRRPNDGDFIKYISSDKVTTILNNTNILNNTAIEMMPEGLISDKIYEGSEDLNFKEVSKNWIYDGLPDSSNSGLLIVDLDNDGDLEIVLNGTNEPASIYSNSVSDIARSNYLKVRLKGPAANTLGIGAKIYVFSNEKMHYDQLTLTRGFLSSQAPEIHFGLGEKRVDSAFVIWPDHTKQYFNPKVNDISVVEYERTKQHPHRYNKEEKSYKILTDFNFKLSSNDYPEFDRERLLPLGITATNPVIAKSDLNGDCIDDFYLGGSKGYPGSLWLSDLDTWRKIEIKSFIEDKQYEDSDAVFIDFDQDGYLDLFVASGGGEYREGSEFLEDRVYMNNKDFIFNRGELATPKVLKNSSIIVASDFDSNGYIDLFVGTRSVPGDYTLNSKSNLFFNYQGVLSEVKELEFNAKLSKVTGASVVDLNRDGFSDLAVALEWEGIILLENDGNGNFIDVTSSKVSNVNGVWQTLKMFDYDQDGDLDILVGNLGLNTRFKTEPKHPMRLCFGDFNSDGTNETLVSIYKFDDYYPLESIDVLKSQINELKKIYPSYSSFAGTSTSELIRSLKSENFDCIEITELRSGVFINENGYFSFSALPDEFQYGPGTTINLLKEDSGFVFGGIKTDVAAVQGAWRSQPFIIISKLESDSKIINPVLFKNNTSLVPLDSSSRGDLFLAASLDSGVYIISIELPFYD